LARLEYITQVEKDKEYYDLLAVERQEAKYKKHYETCAEVVELIVEFSCKIAEYRELTDEPLVPIKLWRDWLSLFRAGKRLYDNENENNKDESNSKTIEKLLNRDTAIMDEEKACLLDECDFNEYKVSKIFSDFVSFIYFTYTTRDSIIIRIFQMKFEINF
jgi:hypothetical protein